jgi:hypothetical protein
MSLCYDTEKWIMISLVSVTICLTLGLMMLVAYGQQLSSTNSTDIIKSKLNLEIGQEQKRLNALEQLRNYCFQHASDSPNPVQDLIDKGFLSESFSGETCKSVNVMIDKIQLDLQVQQQKLRDIEEKQRLQYQAKLREQAMNNTNFNNCLGQNMSVEFCYDTYIGNRPRQ